MTVTDRVVDLLRDLVAINSVNPAYPGGAGEAALADYVEQHCRHLGLTVTRQEVSPGRHNVLVTLPVAGARDTLLFEAHMDTVSLGPMGDDGLKPVVRDGKLFGRGACDTKGSLATMLVAIEHLRNRTAELKCNIALLAAVDEEHAFTGITAFIDSDAPATAAIVGEPTELEIVIAHKGCIRGDIYTRGRAAHSANPELGINAIDGMADVLTSLRALASRHAGNRHPLLGDPTFSIGLIEGGTGVNIVPEHCTITYDRRTVPGEAPDQALAQIDTVLDEVRAARPDITVERPNPTLVSNALDTPPDSTLVHAATAASQVVGLNATPMGVPYGTDASALQQRRGIPAIVFGPGSISLAHGAGEYVPLDDLARAIAFYEGVALRYQGG